MKPKLEEKCTLFECNKCRKAMFLNLKKALEAIGMLKFCPGCGCKIDGTDTNYLGGKK